MRVQFTLKSSTVEGLTERAESIGLPVSRVVEQILSQWLLRKEPLVFGTIAPVVSQLAAPVTQKSVTKPAPQRPPAKIDRTTYRFPICVECGDEVAAEQIGPGDVHTDCPGSGQGIP